jgi:hypothetical protein
MQRQVGRSSRGERVEGILAIVLILFTLATLAALATVLATTDTATLAATPASVGRTTDVQIQMWLTFHHVVEPFAIALIVLFWIARDRTERFDAGAALTCACLLFTVVLLDVATLALIRTTTFASAGALPVVTGG